MELLSPAGSPEALRAAVQSGADAVYLGWGAFNARQSAKNFTDGEFEDALRTCHTLGVKVYLTLNTLVTDRELPQALETARKAALLGVDAVLVQDWGLFSLLRAVLPELPLHASTQMSLFTSGGAREAARMGCERVVIARECSREETAEICRRCGAEVEIFAHGALCMCYSGQCAMSALIGGRSGNRGRCAQPCRLPYGLDGPAKGGHPLSLKDYNLSEALAEAEEAGAACLKLEGRMKRPEYVAVVTGVYARLLREGRGPTAQERQALEQAFSRQGFTDSYWQGRRGAKMFGSRPENTPEPKDLFAAARAAYEKEDARTAPVRFTYSVRAGEAAALTVSDGLRAVTVTGPVPEWARSHALTAEELAARLGKTGGTAYRCAGAEGVVEEGLSLSAAAVNALRRDALSALTAARCAVPERRVLALPEAVSDGGHAGAPELTASVTSLRQLSPALLGGLVRVAAPVEALASAALPEFSGQWCAILPRVWRDGDEPLLREMLNTCREKGVTALLSGNLGHLPLARDAGFALYGDFGLNVFNSRSLEFLRQRGFAGGCVSFELRGSQIRDLQKPIPAEAVVYGRLPLMITENCLAQNAYRCGCDKQGPCVPSGGRCAGAHALHDRTGAAFPLLPAFGHRTEIQNDRPVYLADRTDWRQWGLTYARLRFTTESAEECARILRAYQTGAAAQGAFTRGLYDRGVE